MNAGRFMQMDEFRGESVRPPSLGRYAYALNNPIRYIDPSGNSVQEIAAGFALATVFALAAAYGILCGLDLRDQGRTDVGVYSCVFSIVSLLTRHFPYLLAGTSLIFSLFDFGILAIQGDISWGDFGWIMFAEIAGNAVAFGFGFLASKAGEIQKNMGKSLPDGNWENVPDQGGVIVFGAFALATVFVTDRIANFLADRAKKRKAVQ